MTELKYSLAPWQVDYDNYLGGDVWHIISKNGFNTLSIYNNEANAALIADAPVTKRERDVMLDTLKRIELSITNHALYEGDLTEDEINALNGNEFSINFWAFLVKNAIAKAEGNHANT